MCIAFPGVVVAVDSDGAIVETEGRRRRASTLFLPEIAIGDWVTVAAGAVVERLEPDHAADIQDGDLSGQGERRVGDRQVALHHDRVAFALSGEVQCDHQPRELDCAAILRPCQAKRR